MCHKLLQAYHCGHTKEICTTPCPHAIATATFAPLNPLSDPGTPTSMTSVNTRSDIATLPSQRGRHSPTPSHCPQSEQQTSPHQTRPPSGEFERLPNICPYFFMHKLLASAHPCLVCYMQPRYEGYRKRWIEDYRAGHPGHNLERIEELAGVEQVAERVGLVNVAREMERLGSTGSTGN